MNKLQEFKKAYQAGGGAVKKNYIAMLFLAGAFYLAWMLYRKHAVVDVVVISFLWFVVGPIAYWLKER